MNMRNHALETVSIVTLGCSKNTVDSEVLARQIQANNLAYTNDPREADTVIINTCGFICEAKEESIRTILEAGELKKQGAIQKLLVMGCLTERYRQELEASLPEVDAFFGTTDLDAILATLGVNLKRELLGERSLSTPSHFAYLKISEGCDNPCSFCAIPLMRGQHRSRPLDDIINEAEFLARSGVREIIIIAQDTTYYGLDLYGERRLAGLLQAVADIDGIEWVRLLYTYPSQFPVDVLRVMREHPNVVPYLDIPLQHISDEVLKSMRRGISGRRTRDLLKRIRDEVPGIILRTTLIVGYPSETDEAFRELVEFVQESRFERLGVFTYSQEEGTSAALLGDPVPAETKAERREEIMSAQQDISRQFNESLIGSKLPVLIDRTEDGVFIGRTPYDAPEVDNEVYLTARDGVKIRVGSLVEARIHDATEYDLRGYVQEV
ncbi:MAG: 30S ribosomal protein S12 methylthiotransferase RimO [Chlorobi bacterium]|nr:30S ribosomal protein S12 methylthiotransferase RimO [Chlorobiota bacterium]